VLRRSLSLSDAPSNCMPRCRCWPGSRASLPRNWRRLGRRPRSTPSWTAPPRGSNAGSSPLAPSRRSSTESRATSTRSVHCCTGQWPLENAWWYERCSSVRVRLRAGQRRRGHGGAEQRGGDEAAAVPWRPLRLQCMLTFNGVNSESNRVLDCGTNAHFQWYFMARRTFGGIFRFSHSFDAMKPIFPC